MSTELDLQRRYYEATAANYDGMHVHTRDEHYFALGFMCGMLDFLQIRSILDVGSGTGRVLRYLQEARPDVAAVGVEPVQQLRAVGYKNGLTDKQLIHGDATNLQFPDGSFDLVCEFGVLHHIKDHQKAVSEMLRVAKRGVFISDTNNFGQGRPGIRALKQLLNLLGIWKLVTYIKTGGKGYTFSQGDGVAYSYSVFNSYRQISRSCASIHVLNIGGGRVNPYRTSSHVALLGLKENPF